MDDRRTFRLLTSFFFCFYKIFYLQDVNTYTSVSDSIKLFLVNQFTCRTLAVRGGHGAITSGDGGYSSEKMAQKKKNTTAEGYEIRGECV
jgi:hypothetical protein